MVAADKVLAALAVVALLVLTLIAVLTERIG